jgi:hypothetical protein
MTGPGTLAFLPRLTPRMTLPYPHLRFLRAGLACAVFALASVAHAADIRFVAGLSAEESAAIGVSRLTPAQAAALDRLVSHDATLAQQGGVTAFATPFVERHTPAERTAAGIVLLSDGERAALNSLVARSIALGPPPDQAYVYSPPAKPTPAPAPPETLVSAPLHAELHGDVTLTVGGGSHGSSFFGTALDLNLTDPSGRFTIGAGFESYRGKGFPLLGPWAPYGPYSAYGPVGPAYVGPPYWDW